MSKKLHINIGHLAHLFGRFLFHHAGELRTVASTLQTVVDALPLDHQDKDRLGEVLGSLQNKADNIANGAAAILAKVSDATGAVSSELAATETNPVAGDDKAPAATGPVVELGSAPAKTEG